ncbi:thioredoxin family protein [bacterium SCSIO 12643]|nr:thioredoxin family protein [bacterium SCSIO 12643]
MKYINNIFSQASKLYTYDAYRNLVKSLYEEGKVTGPIQSEVLLDTTKMNLHRFNRLENKYQVSEDFKAVLNQIKGNWTWYLITEGWCGDASQTVPVIAKMAEVSDRIDLKVLLRDDNPEIMDKYLTNGGKAIPILVAINEETGEELKHWGPRPKMIQKMVDDYKATHPDFDKHDFAKKLHVWYTKDKGMAVEEDIIDVLNSGMVKSKEEFETMKESA